MKFLANFNPTNNHLTEISKSLENYTAAYFAVAFLKMSGFTNLSKQFNRFLEKGGCLKIITGQYFALTEPKALYALKNLFKKFPNAKLYLAKTDIASSVFHPKLYLFKSIEGCRIISGSANLTQGGLVSNKETSILIECSESEDFWVDSKNYFENLIKPENAVEATQLVIQQYEVFYEQQKQINKQIKPIPIKSKSQIAFNYENLINHFKKFNTVNRQENFKRKLDNYKEARKILDKIANSSDLTQKQFESLLDNLVGSKEIKSLWHSGSLYRLRKSVYNHYLEFRELVNYIKEHKNDSASIVFEKAKEMVKPIEGAAINYVAEIMMTYNSTEFANLNKNPITVLREEAGVYIKSHSSSFNGADYEKYNCLIKEICFNLGLQNMLEADSFFNEIYWKIK